jgi:sporulation protein YlmC with PRC-barrel domain
MTDGGDRVGLAHHVLDHQLVDSRGERCGKVDDLALETRPDGTVEVRGVLAGPGVLRRRARHGWLRWLVGLAGDRQVEVPWQHVAQIVDHVSLAMPAPDLGLAEGEERAARVLGRVLGDDAHPVRLGADQVQDSPIAPDTLRLSALLGRTAVDTNGRPLGHLHELKAEKSGRVLGEAAGNAWVVVGACVGRSAIAARLGVARRRAEVRAVERWPQTPAEPIMLGRQLQ